MSFYVPRPAREIVYNLRYIYRKINSKNLMHIEVYLINYRDGAFIVKDQAEFAIKSALRLSVAVIALSILYQMESSRALGLAIAASISLPSAVIAAGSWMLTHGATQIVGSIASRHFMSFGLGVLLCKYGWFALEHHDAYALGIAENQIRLHSKSLAPKLIEMLK